MKLRLRRIGTVRECGLSPRRQTRRTSRRGTAGPPRDIYRQSRHGLVRTTDKQVPHERGKGWPVYGTRQTPRHQTVPFRVIVGEPIRAGTSGAAHLRRRNEARTRPLPKPSKRGNGKQVGAGTRLACLETWGSAWSGRPPKRGLVLDMIGPTRIGTGGGFLQQLVRRQVRDDKARVSCSGRNCGSWEAVGARDLLKAVKDPRLPEPNKNVAGSVKASRAALVYLACTLRLAREGRRRPSMEADRIRGDACPGLNPPVRHRRRWLAPVWPFPRDA